MRKLSTSVIALGLTLAPISVAHAQGLAAPQQGTGLIPLSDEEYDALDERDPLMRGALPEFIDLSSFLPEAGHQGAQGSCVGWAVGYALKTYHEAKEGQIVRPDDYYHFSPAFIYNTIKQVTARQPVIILDLIVCAALAHRQRRKIASRFNIGEVAHRNRANLLNEIECVRDPAAGQTVVALFD
ncbi:MAG: hypothetical protein AAFQ12_13665, partial [Pseudomonadota bacterium]